MIKQEILEAADKAIAAAMLGKSSRGLPHPPETIIVHAHPEDGDQIIDLLAPMERIQVILGDDKHQVSKGHLKVQVVDRKTVFDSEYPYRLHD